MKAKKTGKIKVWQSDKNDLWYFTVQSANGKKVAQSEAYKTKRKAIQTANRLGDLIKSAILVVDDK